MAETSEMDQVLNFEPLFAASLPEPHTLVLASNLTLHPNVSCVVLHGSRELFRSFRPDSDIDLSLIVDMVDARQKEELFAEVLDTTLKNWQSPIDPDLALIFETRNCGLKCFDQASWNAQICRLGGMDCFGLYKTQ